MVVRTLIEREGVTVCGVDVGADNAAYIHDRRGGQRHFVAETAPSALSRHDLDELYGAMLVEGLAAKVCVLGGPQDPDVLPASIYRRLASDLGASGCAVIADLAGEFLAAVAAGGVTVLKVSDEELLLDGRVASNAEAEVLAANGHFACQRCPHGGGVPGRATRAGAAGCRCGQGGSPLAWSRWTPAAPGTPSPRESRLAWPGAPT